MNVILMGTDYTDLRGKPQEGYEKGFIWMTDAQTRF
jgi:hypothetical protein